MKFVQQSFLQAATIVAGIFDLAAKELRNETALLNIRFLFGRRPSRSRHRPMDV
jgi:hypothetical protein